MSQNSQHICALWGPNFGSNLFFRTNCKLCQPGYTNKEERRDQDLIAGWARPRVSGTGDMLITAGRAFKTLPFVRHLSTHLRQYGLSCHHCHQEILLDFGPEWTSCFYHEEPDGFDVTNLPLKISGDHWPRWIIWTGQSGVKHSICTDQSIQ